MKNRIVASLAVFALTFVSVPLMTAAPIDTTPKSPNSKKSPSEALFAALDKTVTVEMADTALPEVVNQLGTQAKVSITLDRSALQLYGDPNAFIVSLTVKDMPLKQALRKAIGTYNLSYGVVGDTILVSTEDGVIAKQIGQRIDVDLDAVPLKAAIKNLARETGTNLVIDPRCAKLADNQVTLKLTEVPLDAAVRLMAELADLRSVRVSNVILVTTSERAEKLKNDVNSDQKPANPGVYPPGVPLPAVGIGGGIGIAFPAAPAIAPPAAPGVVPGNADPAPEKPAAPSDAEKAERNREGKD